MRGGWGGAALAVSAALAVAGCGAAAATSPRPVAGRRLSVYLSLPFEGPSAPDGQAALGGVELALDAAHHRVGRYRITLQVLDDATPAARGWDPGQTLANARRAAADPRAIGYIGELNSGASAISVPQLNRAGIAQISPASTAVGLTSALPGASPGEPEKYYPAQRRTFVRVVPDDRVQATVQVRLQLQEGCERVVVLDDGEVDGRDGAASFAAAARAAGLTVAAVQEFDPRATDYRAFAATVAPTGAQCVLVSALPQSHTALLVAQVAAADPHVLFFAWSGLAVGGFTDPAQGGIPASLDPRVLVTVPAPVAADATPAGRQVIADAARRFGAAGPLTLDGYEAMRLMLGAIARATDGGRRAARRGAVLTALFAGRRHHGVLGAYRVRADGDTTLDRYAVERVSDGRLVLWKAMTG